MLYCFLDTNIFLHFQTFDEVDWHRKLGIDGVCLVVSFQVIDDIDKFKNDSSNSKRQKRARLINKKLDQYETDAENPIREGVSLRILKPISKEWLRQKDFDPNDTDSVIIGNAKYFSDSNPTLNVVCISDDSGFRRRAKLHGIVCIDPDDKIARLPAETNPSDAKIRALEKAVEKLKDARVEPDLVGGFRHKGSLSRVVRFRINFGYGHRKSFDLENFIEQKRQELQYSGRIEPEAGKSKSSLPEEDSISGQTVGGFMDNLYLAGLQYPSTAEVKEYEHKVEEYLKEYQSYVKEFADFYSKASRTRPLYFMIENTGTAPAEDIDIRLHLPDGLKLSNDPLRLPEEPMPPNQPQPKSRLDSVLRGYNSPILDSIRNLSTYHPQMFSSAPSTPPTVRGPFIRKTNSYDVDFERANLNHHYSYTWQPFFICFDKSSKYPTAIEVTCRILAANLPHPADYKLRIHID